MPQAPGHVGGQGVICLSIIFRGWPEPSGFFGFHENAFVTRIFDDALEGNLAGAFSMRMPTTLLVFFIVWLYHRR